MKHCDCGFIHNEPRCPHCNHRWAADVIRDMIEMIQAGRSGDALEHGEKFLTRPVRAPEGGMAITLETDLWLHIKKTRARSHKEVAKVLVDYLEDNEPNLTDNIWRERRSFENALVERKHMEQRYADMEREVAIQTSRADRINAMMNHEHKLRLEAEYQLEVRNK